MLELIIAPVTKISDVLAKPTGTLVTQVLLSTSYFVTGEETVLSAIILPFGIGWLLTVGVDVILFKETVPALNNR